MGSLAAKLAAGNQAAFGELYDRCVEQLHRYLAVRLGSWQDAEDVIQETFVRLARNREKLCSVQNLMAYVFTIARNEANIQQLLHHLAPPGSIGAAQAGAQCRGPRAHRDRPGAGA